MTPITNRPVFLMSSGTVAAISGTAPGTATGVAVDVLAATLAGRASPPPDRPSHCHTPNVPSAATNTTTATIANARRDTPPAPCFECFPERPVVRTGVSSARRAAAANSPAV